MGRRPPHRIRAGSRRGLGAQPRASWRLIQCGPFWGCSSAWQSTCMACRGSGVQIPSAPREPCGFLSSLAGAKLVGAGVRVRERPCSHASSRRGDEGGLGEAQRCCRSSNAESQTSRAGPHRRRVGGRRPAGGHGSTLGDNIGPPRPQRRPVAEAFGRPGSVPGLRPVWLRRSRGTR